MNNEEDDSWFVQAFLISSVCIVSGLFIAWLITPAPHKPSDKPDVPKFVENQDGCPVYEYYDNEGWMRMKKCVGHTVYYHHHYCGKACWTWVETSDIKDVITEPIKKE